MLRKGRMSGSDGEAVWESGEGGGEAEGGEGGEGESGEDGAVGELFGELGCA